MKEKLFELLDSIGKLGDLNCHEEIQNFMEKLGAKDIQVSVDDMFDSPGLDVYSVSVAWLENGKIQLAVSPIFLD